MSVTDKRAALELHALGRRDRDWILGRLPADERQRVLPLLAELDGMDIRFDLEANGLPAPVDRADGHRAAAPPPSAMPSPLAALRAAPAAVMTQLLAAEPPWFVRTLLAIEAWPWAAAVRAGLSQQSAARTAPHTTHVSPAAVSTAIVELLARRLDAHAPAAATESKLMNGRMNGHRHAAVEHGGWSRIWPRVRRWLP